jgi:hypothetical protein
MTDLPLKSDSPNIENSEKLSKDYTSQGSNKILSVNESISKENNKIEENKGEANTELIKKEPSPAIQVTLTQISNPYSNQPTL